MEVEVKIGIEILFYVKPKEWKLIGKGNKDSWNVLELQQVVKPRIIRLGICPSALVYDENLGNEEKSHIF